MALTCTVAVVALVACGAPSVGPPPPSATVPTDGGGLFRGAQPWTADVSGAPASERSAAILTALNDAGGWGNGNVLQIDFAMPVLTAGSETPRMTVNPNADYCFGGVDCDPVPAEMPVPPGAHLEGSQDLTCDAANEDCHLLVADPAERRLYEIYQGTQAGEGLTAGGFFVWDLDRTYTDELRGPQCTSADAAGFPIAALTPTADEVAAGRIDHALRFILPNDRMKADVYVPPATHAGGPENTNPDAPPYGVNLRLRPDVDVSSYTPHATRGDHRAPDPRHVPRRRRRDRADLRRRQHEHREVGRPGHRRAELRGPAGRRVRGDRPRARGPRDLRVRALRPLSECVAIRTLNVRGATPLTLTHVQTPCGEAHPTGVCAGDRAPRMARFSGARVPPVPRGPSPRRLRPSREPPLPRVLSPPARTAP